MTSLAFILGVLPLAISTGAGSGSQNAIGIGVIGGMLRPPCSAIFFVPLFFVTVGLVGRRSAASATGPPNRRARKDEAGADCGRCRSKLTMNETTSGFAAGWPLLLGGCGILPEYIRPAAPVPAA